MKTIQPIFTSTKLHVGSVLKLSSDPSSVLRRITAIHGPNYQIDIIKRPSKGFRRHVRRIKEKRWKTKEDPDALKANFGRRMGGRMIQVLRETMINAKDGKKSLMVVMYESQKSAIEEFLKDFQFRNNITVVLYKKENACDN